MKFKLQKKIDFMDRFDLNPKAGQPIMKKRKQVFFIEL